MLDGLKSSGALPVGVDSRIFCDAEAEFSSLLETVPWLGALHRVSMALGAGGSLPASFEFWPSFAETDAILACALPGAGVGEAAVHAWFSGHPRLRDVAALSWLRGGLEDLLLPEEADGSRLALGRLMVRELPSVDRILWMRLEESSLRADLSADGWALCVGEMCLRVQDMDAPMVLEPAALASGLGRAPMSLWEDVVRGQLARRGASGRPAARRFSSIRAMVERDAFGFMADLGVCNYVLRGLGCQLVQPGETDWLARLHSELGVSTQAEIRRQVSRMLARGCARVVARHGFLGGFLKSDQHRDAGVPRVYLKSFARAFASELFFLQKESLLEQMGSLAGVGGVFYQAVTGRLWPFFAQERLSLTHGLALAPSRDSLALGYEREIAGSGVSLHGPKHGVELSIAGTVAGLGNGV
ncbi:hypothetical protein OH491_24015 [Termitidicoccus mucosus]|uniref:hypothetical protein n=1 Tax=Termitidicoccus mucosus TaxID=1184151 RepID=UPI0011AB3A84